MAKTPPAGQGLPPGNSGATPTSGDAFGRSDSFWNSVNASGFVGSNILENVDPDSYVDNLIYNAEWGGKEELGYNTFIAESLDEAGVNAIELSGTYFQPQKTSGTTKAAALTDIPTSTTDASRPRTVAAGWDPETLTLTVMFRDGTLYNYGPITHSEWIGFHQAISKGKTFLNVASPANGMLDGKFLDRALGPADISTLSPEVQEAMYRVARTSQIKFSKKFRYYNRKQLGEKRRRTETVIGVRNVDLGRPRANGKNPHSGAGNNPSAGAGTNPNQK